MKRNFKKLFLLLAVIVTAVVCFAFSASALDATGQCGDNVYWEYNAETGELVISGEGEMEKYILGDSPFSYSNVKSIIINHGVTSIGDEAFEACYSLSSVTIGDSVNFIGKYAFSSCESLEIVMIPDGVTTIGEGAFNGCDSLGSIIIPDSLINIGKDAFFETAYYDNESNWIDEVLYIENHLIKAREGIQECKIKSETKTIAAEAFFDCEDLVSLTIPDSLTNIGKYAFHGCYYIKNIYAPSIKNWLKISFENESSNPICGQMDNLCFNGETVTELSIPDSVTSIGDYAFSNFDSLKSVEIPDSITSIGCSAFADCSSLTSAIIPDSVISIGDNAFNYCTRLEYIEIGNGITEIADSMFYNCRSLTNLTMGDNVIRIGDYAFAACYSLANISIPDGVTTIGEGAFKNCEKLESIKFPVSITDIGSYAFYECSNLTSIKIPDSVTNIGCSVFSICKKLTSIIVDPDNKHYSNDEYGVLFDKNKTKLLQYPSGNNIAYYTVPDGVIYIEDTAFENCDTLQSVVLPNGVKTIAASMFYNCDDLKSITMGDDVTSIGERAFYYCSSLTSIIIPDSVTSIGVQAFNSCESLKNITIPNSVKSIGNGAFAYCKNLKGIKIPDSVTSIGQDAFHDCDNLAYVIIGKGIKSIAESTFAWSDKLENVIIPESVTKIDYAAFSGCNNLKTVYFTGTEEQWNSINISDGNFYLSKANIIFLNGEQITDGNITKCNHENKTIYSYQSATCENVGYTEGEYCSDCETWLVEREEIPATDHNYRLEDSKGATCSESGYKTYVCENDVSHGYTEIIDKLPHTEVSYDGKNPTCTESGWDAYIVCSICGYSTYNELKALGHTEVIKPAIAATCVKTGFSEGKYCSTCSEVLVIQQIVGFTDHSFSVFVSDNNATFTADGTKTAFCDYGCGNKKTVTDKGSKLTLGKASKLTATPTNSSITLIWNKAKNATGYSIYYKFPGEDNWNKCVSYTTAKSHLFKNLPFGRVYCFAIRSVGKQADGTVVLGPYAEITTATKAAVPSKITSTQTTSSINLTWAKSAGATGYRIYFKSGNTWKIAVKATAATSRTFKNLKPGAKFTFAVRPFIKTDSGIVWSDYATFTTSTFPTNPTVKVTTPSKGKATVSWNAVNGAEGYQLWYKTGNGSYKLYKTYTKAGTLNFSNLKSGTKYTFAVRAVIKTDGGTVRSGYKAVSVTVK